MSHVSRFLWAAEHTLLKFARPMSAGEIYVASREAGYFPDTFQGQTPEQTMKSKLSTHILRFGDESIFVRTSPGRFYLRELVQREGDIYTAVRWAPPPSKEIVTVVPATALRGRHPFQGIATQLEPRLSELFQSDICRDLPRADAELTEEFKQIITYVMVRRGGDFLVFRRGVFNQTADMLRGSDCIGFGGHVNAEDKSLMSGDDAGLMEAAARELREELALPAEDLGRLSVGIGLRVRGILNDDSSGVGRRHFAVVFEYQVSADPAWEHPVRGEESITKLRWVGVNSKPLNLDDYEYWSQLCLREFAPELVELQPSFKVRRRSALKAPHLLCLVGQIGSGKTEAASALTTRFGYGDVNTGRVVADLIGLPPVPTTPREAFQREAQRFITSNAGPRRLARAIADKAESLNSERVLVDGIRQLETFNELRGDGRFQRVPVVYVHTAADIAYEFYKSRERSTASMSEFLAVRDSPVEQEIPLMLRDADAVLYNWVGKSEFEDALRGILG